MTYGITDRMVGILLPLLVLVITTSRASPRCQSSIEGREFIFGIIQTTRSSYDSHNTKSNDTIELHITNSSPNHNRIHLQIPYTNEDTYHDIPPDQSKTVNINSDIQTTGTFHGKRGLHITSDYDISVLVTCVKFGLKETAIESYNAFPTRSAGRRFFISSGEKHWSWRPSRTVLILITSNVDNNLVKFYNTSTSLIKSTIVSRFDVYQSDNYQGTNTGLLIEAESDITVTIGVQEYYYYTYDGRTYSRGTTVSLTPYKYWPNRYIVPQTIHTDTASVRIWTENLFNRVNISTNTQSLLSYNQSFVNISVALTAENPFSIMQNSFNFNNTDDGFMVLVPGVNQYINDYHFTVPHLHSNVTNFHMKHYISVIIPTLFKDDLLIDEVSLQNMGNSRIREQSPVPSPYSNYTVLSFNISEGYHRVRHRLSHVKFGLLVYGTTNGYWYRNNDYTNSYGFYAGFNLHGDKCEDINSGPTTPSVPQVYTSSKITKRTDQTNVSTCYSCEGLTLIDLCDTVKACHSKEVCFAERQNISGRIVYRSGCLAVDVCASQYQESLSKDDFCVECCSGNFCNNKGCGGTGLPSRDQRGPVCYDCQHVPSPSLCTSVTLCSQHQVCRIEKLTWGEHFHYKMGCANRLCDSLTRRVHHLSKRATPVCHSCCTDDYCNKNCIRTSNGTEASVLVG